jgi:HEAT repeat protein
VPPLLEALRDADDDEASGRAGIISMIGDEAVPALISTLAGKHNDGNVGSYAACTLGEIGSRRTFDVLLSSLEDEHNSVRGWAAYALGQLGDRCARSTDSRSP